MKRCPWTSMLNNEDISIYFKINFEKSLGKVSSIIQIYGTLKYFSLFDPLFGK